MLNGMILQLVLTAIEEGPQIFDEAQKLFADLGGKDDGIAKLQKAATSFLQLANHAATASVMAAKAPVRVPTDEPAYDPALPADSPSGAASEPARPAPEAAATEIMNSADRAARQAEAESVS